MARQGVGVVPTRQSRPASTVDVGWSFKTSPVACRGRCAASSTVRRARRRRRPRARRTASTARTGHGGGGGRGAMSNRLGTRIRSAPSRFVWLWLQFRLPFLYVCCGSGFGRRLPIFCRDSRFDRRLPFPYMLRLRCRPPSSCSLPRASSRRRGSRPRASPPRRRRRALSQWKWRSGSLVSADMRRTTARRRASPWTAANGTNVARRRRTAQRCESSTWRASENTRRLGLRGGRSPSTRWGEAAAAWRGRISPLETQRRVTAARRRPRAGGAAAAESALLVLAVDGACDGQSSTSRWRGAEGSRG